MTDSAEAENRIAGGLCLAFGVVLTVWAWRSGMRGEYEMTPAVLGPTLVSLGAGLLIHPARIALAGINTVTRFYGIGGALATVAMLAYFGFFTRPRGTHRSLWLMESALPFVLLVYWSLPSKWLGGPAYDPLAGMGPRPP